MSYRWSVIILFSSLALGQSSVTAPSTKPAVAPDAPVVTIDGLCDKPAPRNADPRSSKAKEKNTSTATAAAATDTSTPVPKADCKSVVTREQLEGIALVVGPKLTGAKLRRFASDLPELMLFAHTAQEMGLDKDPRFQDFLWYKYSQSLQQLLLVTTQRKMGEMSDAEVEKYYKEHPERFVEYALMRVFVPKHEPDTSHPNYDPAALAAAKAKAEADDEEMLKVAKSIQREAAAGGDFEKLQAKAYKAAHSDEEPPDVDLGDKWTIDNMPKDYKDLLVHLQPGQVAELAPHPFGWEIFKLVSKRTVPLSNARQMLQGLRMKDWREGLASTIHTQLNDEYFGPPEAATDTEPTEP
jgi:PPIC-type PPIASE domain